MRMGLPTVDQTFKTRRARPHVGSPRVSLAWPERQDPLLGSRSRDSRRFAIEIGGARQHAEMALHGDLVGASAAGMLARRLVGLVDAAASDARDIVIDASRLGDADAAGVAALLKGVRRAGDPGISLVLRDAPLGIRGALDGACADAQISIFRSASELRLVGASAPEGT